MPPTTRIGQGSELQKVRPAEELADVAGGGGRDGEPLLKRLVGSSYQFKEACLLKGRRIPSKRQGRRREIDLIVCTPKMIHLIRPVRAVSLGLPPNEGGTGTGTQADFAIPGTEGVPSALEVHSRV